eukprot:TRINITY_DN7703_c0_g1_i1.p1 TRINITY_DN7703_c0_g1~~TRINITY_DN7703_c0_g1_i1.p1  ORF type:complete len:268 (+),score=21.30 TRINITY_DN7703_c0_g1_i1:52-855(+)
MALFGVGVSVPSLFTCCAAVVLDDLGSFSSRYARLTKAKKALPNLKKLMSAVKKDLLRHACLLAVTNPPGPLNEKNFIHLISKRARKVTLSPHPYLFTEAASLKLSTHCSQSFLTKINLGGCQTLSPKSIALLVEGFPLLNSTNFSCTNFDPACANSLKKCQALKSLTLQNCPRLTTEAVSTLVQHCTLLEILDLSSNRHSVSLVFIEESKCTNLHTLYLNSIVCADFPNSAVEALGRVSSLKTLHIGWSKLTQVPLLQPNARPSFN